MVQAGPEETGSSGLILGDAKSCVRLVRRVVGDSIIRRELPGVSQPVGWLVYVLAPKGHLYSQRDFLKDAEHHHGESERLPHITPPVPEPVAIIDRLLLVSE
jgi:hypothetical protein